MRAWVCSACAEPQVVWGELPADRLCHLCSDRRYALALVEERAAIPPRYRGLTRGSWSAHFGRTWPAELAAWPGPKWAAFWGPTGTGKTAAATILLAEHVGSGRRGRWVSGASLSRGIQRDFATSDELIAPLLVTSLLVFDEPLAGAAAEWYLERVGLISRHRDEAGLPTIITSQLLPELMDADPPEVPPALLSRWLSGLQIPLVGEDVRLREST